MYYHLLAMFSESGDFALIRYKFYFKLRNIILESFNFFFKF